MNKKILLILAILTVLSYTYWTKSQRGIDLFENFSLSKTLTFLSSNNSNQNNSVINYVPSHGIIIDENFEMGLHAGGWETLWSRDRGSVIRRVIQDEANGSSLLFIRNLGYQDWAIEHSKLIVVSSNERYYYEGIIRITDKAVAGFSVILYNQEKKVLDWNFAEKFVEKEAAWKKISNTFSIPEGVSYIKLRITGSGKGDIYVSYLLLEKTSQQS